MRKTPFTVGEFYHIYNRGTDHRDIVKDVLDRGRFFQSVKEFNVLDAIGSIYEEQFRKNKLGTPTTKSKKRLVNIIAYCLNQNHYHFILEELVENGIERFMQKLGGGYTRYFNVRHKRNGVLFQGKFKSVHITSDAYLLHLSAYVNLNDRVHKIPAGISWTSWNEYMGKNKGEGMCSKDIILSRFRKKDEYNEYKEYAESAVKETVRRRDEDQEFSQLLLE